MDLLVGVSVGHFSKLLIDVGGLNLPWTGGPGLYKECSQQARGMDPINNIAPSGSQPLCCDPFRG